MDRSVAGEEETAQNYITKFTRPLSQNPDSHSEFVCREDECNGLAFFRPYEPYRSAAN